MTEDRNVVVGKHTLESLTVGMYADNRIIFREYVQNATDAIDKAIAAGIIKKEDGRIDITINTDRKEIRIRDNGIGVPTQDVYHKLGDIGKSEKSHVEERGFRGIGRLGGLGYCTELQFITSYQGEDCRTITSWNARELRRLLQPNNIDYESIVDVVNAVTSQDTQPEKSDEHYFEVVLAGIEEGHDNLLDVQDIKDYLSQVAPVPFNYNLGIELQRINQKLQELGKEPEEYKVYLNSEQVYKLYRRQVTISDKKKDFIKQIAFFEGYRNDGSLFFVGWYGVTDLSGMVKEDNANGLRVRKRNILIGDNRTLDEFFGNNKTYQNFNRWFVGEIYVFEENLIPNARRDDFEKNEPYFAFKREVEKTTHKLARLPHPLSKVRSSEKKIQEIPQKIQEIQQELSTAGITETRKGQLFEQVDDLKRKAKQIDPNAYAKIPTPASLTANPTVPISDSKTKSATSGEQVTEDKTAAKVKEVKQVKESLFSELEQLENKIETSINHIAQRLPSTISRACRKEIDKIFNVIDRVLDEGLAKELKAQIIEELQPKAKKDKPK